MVWLELPRAGELGETVIGAAEEHPTRLIRYDLAQCERSVEVGALDDYAVSADGARLAYRIGESLEIKPAGDPDGEVVSVDLDRIRVTVEPPAEWTQMYHEAWRLMRDNFWRADMAGVDWAAMADRYRPLLDRIGSADDLHDVLWELQGEMGSSHAAGCCRRPRAVTRRWLRACSAPTSSAPRTGPGGSRGSCPASRR